MFTGINCCRNTLVYFALFDVSVTIGLTGFVALLIESVVSSISALLVAVTTAIVTVTATVVMELVIRSYTLLKADNDFTIRLFTLRMCFNILVILES